VAAVDQLDAELDECLASMALEVLCSMVDNATAMSDAASRAGAPLAFHADRAYWRVVAACAMKRLNDELVRRHDQESEVPDVD
jgi:hypothetical protein